MFCFGLNPYSSHFHKQCFNAKFERYMYIISIPRYKCSKRVTQSKRYAIKSETPCHAVLPFLHPYLVDKVTNNHRHILSSSRRQNSRIINSKDARGRVFCLSIIKALTLNIIDIGRVSESRDAQFRSLARREPIICDAGLEGWVWIKRSTDGDLDGAGLKGGGA